ncbi:MAG: hypothetical protein MI923_03510, partial [Phycisphaerales bacterium]|nr:hypothetical protein [Phycisphaerales bacterium]
MPRRVTDTQSWTAASEKATSFSYDDLGNRKTHIYRGGDHFLQQPTLAYEHDKANRMSKITGSGSYSGVSNPAYDKAGNQTFAYSSD